MQDTFTGELWHRSGCIANASTHHARRNFITPAKVGNVPELTLHCWLYINMALALALALAFFHIDQRACLAWR